MAEIDVAIFAFDGDERLRLVNRAGERLLGAAARAPDRPRPPTSSGCATCSRRGAAHRQDMQLPRRRRAAGRCGARQFWQGGPPHELLVLADVSQPLREQERQAWQRLIRVIGHELNNSLAPIKSIAGSLRRCWSRTRAAGRLARRHAARPRR